MCKFASFIITKTGEFWASSDKHEDIVDEHCLSDLDEKRHPGLVRVEILPNEQSRKDLASWTFTVDQDMLPDWTFSGDPELERRSREALARRAAAENWFVEVIFQQSVVGYAGIATAGVKGTATAGVRGTATAGDGGTATAGARGTATAGYAGTATAGYAGTATAGYAGTATAGDGSTATAGDGGTATAGCAGTATAGDGGTATAGARGTATAGARGTATAGERGILSLRWWDGSRHRIATFYVGDGVEPNVKYRLDEKGQIVKAEMSHE